MLSHKRHPSGGILLVAVMVFGLATVAIASDVLDRIVAVVNEDIILLSELDARLRPYAQRIHEQGFDAEKERQTIFKVRSDLLNQLIDEKLTDQEIKRNDIHLDDAEIDATIERIKQANSFTDEDLRRFLAQNEMTLEEYRNKVKEQVLRARLVNYEVKSKIAITDEAIHRYYDDHPDIYGGARQYHLRHILMTVPPNATENDRAMIRQKMEKIRAQAADGADFADLARTNSQGPAAKDGGDIGEFKNTSLSPKIRTALEGLKAGQPTAVLETERGFQLFYVEAVGRSEGKPIESVEQEIHQKLYNEVVDKQFLSWLDTLRKQSHIKIIN
ncbi:peptidylprolyl isomerase [Desulfosarcina cetonica]|uniref:peptidylprolyl isomerase n=1 Tax=Desulfosarcina cetonica TaxID=90730 RepID=UPI0006D1A300|nr:peptidylprolyl isomerase [Desulfosarcina cetonica]